MEKRVEFPNGKQKEFLVLSKKELILTWPEFAQKLNVNIQTLEKSYRFELCRLPYNTFKEVCRLRNIIIEECLKDYKAKIVDFDPYSIIGRKAFGENRTNLPEVDIKFKCLPKDFDISEIITNKFDKEKGLKLPKKLTPNLAEEIGTHLGDGFLSNRKYEYRLKGNKNEKEYYDSFVKPLFKNLFNIDVNLKEYETTYGFELFSKAFWEFKNKILKISAGRKTEIGIPEIIKVSNINILTAFVRGLFDTDGSISFIKKYGFKNYYPLISIALKSKRLILETTEILKMLGLEPKVYFDNKKEIWSIKLNGYNRLEKYSKLIGWSNPKHIDKVIKWKRQYLELGEKVMVTVVQPG